MSESAAAAPPVAVGLLGRDEVVRDLLREPRAVLLGAVGSGTTVIAHAVAEHRVHALVAGRDAVDGVAFLPVTCLLGRLGLGDAEPLGVLANLPGRLLEVGEGLVVDDAERLDPSSAVLIAQAARAGVPILLTAKRIVDLAPPLRDLALTLPRFELEALSPADADALADRTARGRLDPPSRAVVRRRSGGNPGAIVALVGAAVEESAVVVSPAGLHLTRLPVTARALEIQGVHGERAGEHRALLQTLALAGPLPIALHDPDLLAAAVASGLVEEDGEAAWVSSPLLADQVREALSPERRRQLAATVAEQLEGRSADVDPAPSDAEWRTRAGVLRLLAGRTEAVAEFLTDAVAWLREQDRRTEALELLDALPPDAAASPSAVLARADVLADLGRVSEALDLLDDLAASADAEVAAEVIVRWAGLLGGGAADDERLERRVGELADRLDAHRRAEVRAVLARRRVIRGAPQADDHGDRWASLLRESLTGSLQAARAGASSGSRRDDPQAPPDASAHLRTLIRFLSLVYDGEIVEAREIAEHQFGRASRRADPLLGLWSYNRTKIALHAGQVARAAALGAEMCHHLAWRDPFGLLASGQALQASALARSGRLEQAVDLIEQLGPDDVLLPRARLGRARVLAELHLRDGDPASAAAALREAGEHAVAHDEAHSGLLALDEAFWVDPTVEAAAPLIAADGRSGLATAFAARARGILAGDPAVLADVAVELERMIQPGRAAATWRAVGGLLAGPDPSGAAAALRQALRLELAWGCHPWPRPFADAVALSPREREIAGQAAARRPSREIALDLGLSARTVDNHLARVFRKLGIGGRDELAEVLGLR